MSDSVTSAHSEATTWAPSEATLSALELPALLQVLSRLGSSDLGRQRILELRPLTPEKLQERRGRYEEARRLLVEGRLVPSFDRSLGEVLQRLATGRPPVEGQHLKRLAAMLRALRGVQERLEGHDPPAPHLGQLLSPLKGAVELVQLEKDIDRSLDARGEVRDNASPLLVKLRDRIRSLRDRLYDDLRGYLDAHREEVSEDTIPLRGGRLVLSMQSGAQGRLEGLTHGRSGTGKSVYFEPLEAVKSNNQLQQSADDEQAERARILRDLIARARESLSLLADGAEILAELDLLQAAADYAARVDGRLAATGSRHELKLLKARHPLLAPALASLREEALGTAGHRGEVIPLVLSFDTDRRVLVVTGPNAGGKTVALKTVGLLALCHACGLPVPAAAGTTFPPLRQIIATVGDEQDLLAERSTFSGRLLRLREVWEHAGPDTLVLLDELGSGTDPEEGSALAVTLAETLLERETLALVTTHLVQVAAAAMESEGATCAAMEFDSASGTPTFRLQPGPPGGSEALSLARRLGLPAQWLDRAEARLGSEHRSLRRLLSEVERLRAELEEEQAALRVEQDDAAKLRRRLAEREAELVAERKQVSARLRRELEEFRRGATQRLRDEVETLRRRAKAQEAKAPKRGAEAGAVQRIFEAAPSFQEAQPEEPVASGSLEVGGKVRHRALGWEGTLERLDGKRATVVASGKRLTCTVKELVPAATPASSSRAGGRGAAGRQRSAKGSRTTVSRAATAEAGGEINLIGTRVEPALERLDYYLDQALLDERPSVRIVHGHGTGRLRRAVREHLRHHPAVEEQRAGGPEEGGNGATVAVLAR
ncbi:MAG: Smr/MutS family protein [Acidobacteriota bacterium]